MEQESSFRCKDLFFYAIKRWVVAVILLAAGLGAGAVIASTSNTSQQATRHQATLSVVGFLDYFSFHAENFEATIEGENLAEVIYNDYWDNVNRAINAMRADVNFDFFGSNVCKLKFATKCFLAMPIIPCLTSNSSILSKTIFITLTFSSKDIVSS